MRPKRKKKLYKAKNLSPGTMAYIGKKESLETHAEIIDYSPTQYKVIKSNKVEDAYNFKNKDTVTWININGLNMLTDIEKLGRHYDLHPLTLENIVNTNLRPKFDEFDNYLFIAFKMLYYKGDNELYHEHISMIVGETYVLTFQEADGDVFDELRKRISIGKGRVRTLGPDYLMFAILDVVVDNYYTVIEAFGDSIEELEDAIFNEQSKRGISNSIQDLKHEVVKMRRSILPLREVINRLEKTDSAIIEQKTHSFIRNLYDHMVQVNESIELNREMVWSLMDMYMTNISNKMNEVMKMLTIIATIFIPLTFIVGIYGMNFDNMPELRDPNGYFKLLGGMAIIFILLLVYFKRKKWL